MKQYKPKERSDYIFYFQEIIRDLSLFKDKLKYRKKEIRKLLKVSKSSKSIDAEVYESISERTKYALMYVFNLIGDESKNAVSYRKIRKKIVKVADDLNVELEPWCDETCEILKNFNQHRNWGLHIPESVLNHKREIWRIEGKDIIADGGDVNDFRFHRYDIQYLNSLNREVGDVIDCLEYIEGWIHRDLECLTGKKTRIFKETIAIKSYDNMKAVKASLDTQKGKKT